jgi:hypothetical protein
MPVDRPGDAIRGSGTGVPGGGAGVRRVGPRAGVAGRAAVRGGPVSPVDPVTVITTAVSPVAPVGSVVGVHRSTHVGVVSVLVVGMP